MGSIRKKEVNAMACDESLYRQYLNGDDEGLNALMKKYGDPLTLYIDGYLHICYLLGRRGNLPWN